jgi:pheromone shutdown protein TraB
MKKDTVQYVDNNIAGFGIAASVAIVFNTLLVWAKETSPALTAWMKALTSHHWISQGLFTVLVFLILGVVFSKSKLKLKTSTLTWTILLSSVVSALGIIIWYVFY